MFSDGVLSIFSLLGPTCSVFFTSSSCLRTSISFLSCFTLSAEAAATRQQHTANRHNTSGFILSATGQKVLSEDWLEMRSVAHLTFLYAFLGRQENHSQRVGKQQKPALVTNDFLFHWPLRDPTVSSSCACVGPRRCWCVNVKLHEQEATGGLPIFSLNQWRRSASMSEVLFRRCGIGNLNASRAPRPPTQTHRILLQQQETIINDEASGPAKKTHAAR